MIGPCVPGQDPSWRRKTRRRLSWWLACALILTANTGGLAQPLREIMLPEETIDQWIFGGGNDARTGRQSLDGRLALQVAEVQRLCGLSEAQTQKIQLAGTGDIKHFFNRASVLKRKISRITDQNAVGMAYQETQPLQLEFHKGLFGETSLFAKTLRRTLTPEQTDLHEKAKYERHRQRYRARAAYVLMKLEEVVPLLDDQRRQLLQVIDEHTIPPNQFGQYDTFYTLLQLSNVSEEKLRPLFDRLQWQALRQHLDQSKQFEQFLRANGIVPYGTSADATSAPGDASDTDVPAAPAAPAVPAVPERQP